MCTVHSSTSSKYGRNFSSWHSSFNIRLMDLVRWLPWRILHVRRGMLSMRCHDWNVVVRGGMCYLSKSCSYIVYLLMKVRIHSLMHSNTEKLMILLLSLISITINTCCGWIWCNGAIIWALGMVARMLEGGKLCPWWWGGGIGCECVIIAGPCIIDCSYEKYSAKKQ